MNSVRVYATGPDGPTCRRYRHAEDLVDTGPVVTVAAGVVTAETRPVGSRAARAVAR